MAESIVQVAPDSTGKKLHTNSYTVGANTVEDEFVVLGPYPYPTYTAVASGVSGATANDHMITLNAGASLKVRIHRITIQHSQVATAAAVRSFQVMRTTTAAPTGGTAITPGAFDTADTAGAAARSLPAAKGTESTVLLNPIVTASQAVLATATQSMDVWEWRSSPAAKPIIIPAGTTNGIAIKNLTATANALYTLEIEFTETAF